MKKYLKYILLLLVAMLTFTNKLMADEPDAPTIWASSDVNNSWIFRCDYNLPLKNINNIAPYNPRLRVLMYDELDKSNNSNVQTSFSGALFYLLNPDTQLYDILSLGNQPIQIFDYKNSLLIDNDFYYRATGTDSKTYTCPTIRIVAQIWMDVDYETHSKYQLSFDEYGKVDEDASKYIYIEYTTGVLSINSRLDNDEKDKVREKALEAKKTCDLQLKYGADSSVHPQFQIKLMSDDSIYVSVKADNNTADKIYYSHSNFNIGLDEFIYEFRKEDYEMFQNMLRNDCESDSELGMGFKGNLRQDGETKKVYLISSMDYLEDQNYRVVGKSSLKIKPFDKKTDTCKNMLGDKLVGYLQTAYTIIKIASIIIVIVLAMLDFAQNVLSGKEEAAKIAVKWGKRLVIVIIILLLPTIIDLIGSLFGYEGIACGIK